MAEEFKPIDFDSLGSQKKKEIPEGQESSTFDINNDGSVGFGDVLSGLGDVLLSVPRGVLDAGQGVIDTVDMATNWVGIDIPDTDINFLGDSKTMVGRGAQGLTNFLAGFVPIAGQISKGAKGVQFLSKAAQAAKTTKKGAAAVVVGRGAVAGGITDFAVMDAEMGNLSTMIQDTPALQGLQNPITEYLAHDGDDSELEKRIKNVMEGAGLGIFFDGMIESVKAIRAGQRVRRAGGTPEEAAAARDAEIKPKKPEAEVVDAPDWATPEDTLNSKNEVIGYHGSPTLPEGQLPTTKEAMEVPGAVFFSNSEDVAYGYSFEREFGEIVGEEAGNIQKVALKLENPKVLDFTDEVPDATTLSRLVKEAKAEGHDGLILRNVDDTVESSGEVATTYAVFKDEQMSLDVAASGKPKDTPPPKGPRDPSDPPVDDGAGPRDSGGDDLEGRKPGARDEKYFEENLDRVSDDRSVRQIVKNVVDDAREAGEVAPAERKSHAEMYDEAMDDLDELDEMMGESSGTLKEALAVEGEKAVSGIRRIRRLRLLQKRAAERAKAAAEDLAADGGSRDKQRAYAEARQKLRSVTLAGIEVKRELARELSGLTYTVDDLPEVAHLTARLDDGADDALDDLLSEAGGGNRDIGASRLVDEARKVVALADAAGDAGVVGAVRKTPGVGKMAMTVWVNGLLSGPKTQLVNALSGALATAVRPAEKAAGRFFTGDVRGAMAQLAQYNYILQHAGAATRLAIKTLKSNEPILLRGGKVSEILDASGQESAAVMAAKYSFLTRAGVGIATSPTRVLQSVDEFFKQLNYRSQVMADLQATAAQKGYDDSWVRESAEKIFTRDELFTKDSIRRQAVKAAHDEGLEPGSKEFNRFVRRYYGEMYDKELVQIANQGKRAAEDVTFTRALDEKGQGTIINRSKAIQDIKANFGFTGNLLLPFVRTPAQLIEFFHRRSLGLATEALRGNVAEADRGFAAQFQRLRENGIKELAGATKEQRADFMGRLAVGTTLYGSIATAASMDMLTGSGPKDVNQRRLLEQSGWQPYSVKIGGSYYSYRRFDPFSSFIQVIADVQDHVRYNTRFKGEDEVEIGPYEEITTGISFVLANLVRNKSFFAGMSAFVEALGDTSGRKWTTFSRQMVGSLMPSIASQLNQEYLDNELREPRSAVDAFMRRTPFLSDELPPRRDLFGKPLTVAETITSPILPGPLEVKTTSRSAVRRELAEVGANFGNPRKERSGLDLTQYKMGKYDAFDRYQVLVGEIRIGGRTMEQQMSRLIQRSQYKRMGRESKMDQLSKILRQYRDAAWWQLVKENPQIKRDLRTSDQNEARDMRGQQQLPLSYQ